LVFDLDLPVKTPLGKNENPVSPSVNLFSASPPNTITSPLLTVTSVTISRLISVGD
jgi:hypothetical protein